MTVIDLVRAGVAELGDGASAEALTRFIAERYGARVEARFVPIYRATLRAEVQRQEARAHAARIIEEDRRTRPPGPSGATPPVSDGGPAASRVEGAGGT
jgi:hypothetical protein